MADADEPTQRVLKFPDIHRESQFVQACDLKQVENSQLQEIIQARSISSLVAAVENLKDEDDNETEEED